MATVVTPPSRWSPDAQDRETSDPAAAANDRAGALRAMHQPGAPLVLPNAWDCLSARLVEAAQLPAVATSSAAIADSLGYRDGEATPVGEMLDAISRIVAAVAVPVTADLERGYRMPAAELVERLATTGAVGCNLEDSDPRTGALVDAERQADFLAAVRAAATAAGIDLVLNARIDTHLAGPDREPGARAAETIRRAHRYRAAGADCVYPILLRDDTEIAELVAAGAPVNILAGNGLTVARLAGLGVARISFGAQLYQSTRAHLAGLIGELANPR
ncbi:isocitrate lyase/phosphoenolpyruvate mutase family protein [Micromonospora sp. NPDC048909]|uniref:isocitrate lyase/PEP mutase family protein n=1 Tax=Micromonospora sp. NPDC048909 TaxID=3155643 RepID=UPI0033F4240D